MTMWFPVFLLMGLSGFVIGVIYFQLLWLTIKIFADTRKRPAFSFIGSFFFRNAFLVTTFYLLMGDDWRRVIALTIGFTGARLFMVGKVKKDLSEESGRQLS